MNKVGDLIKKYRKKNGLTQKELANMIGCAEITIRQYELGKRQPNLNILGKLAFALNTNLSDLVDGEFSKFKEGQGHEAGVVKTHDSTAIAELRSKTEQAEIQEQDNIKRIENIFLNLNNDGQKKAIEQVEILYKIPEYRKDTKEP